MIIDMVVFKFIILLFVPICAICCFFSGEFLNFHFFPRYCFINYTSFYLLNGCSTIYNNAPLTSHILTSENVISLSLHIYWKFFFLNQFLLEYSCFTMLCQLLLYSKVNQLYVYIYLLFFQVSFPFRSSQSIEQSSLCYTVGSHQLSILCTVVYICQFCKCAIGVSLFSSYQVQSGQ